MFEQGHFYQMMLWVLIFRIFLESSIPRDDNKKIQSLDEAGVYCEFERLTTLHI